MKVVPFFIILNLIHFDTIAQDCKELNNFNSFHGVKFGQKISLDIQKYFKFENINGKTDSSYLFYSLTEKESKKNSVTYNKFNKWFDFGLVKFSDLQFTCLRSGEVYEFALTKYYDSKDISSLEDSTEIVNNRLPFSFIKITNEITSLFGEMSKTENEKSILGYNLYRIWECENIRITLELWYQQKEELGKFILMSDILITDKKLEKLNKLYNYKN